MNSTEYVSRLLIVEDDLGLQKQLKWCFEEHEVLFAGDRAEALMQLKRHQPAVVLQDLGLPPDPAGVTEGLMTLSEILAASPHCKVIVMTGNHERDNALRAIAAGAYDFYQKPLDTDVLKLLVSRAFHVHQIEARVRELQSMDAASRLTGIIATDDAMLKVCRMVEKVAPANVSVLITGESGTGKELVARAVHENSAHARGRFVAINCAAIPEQLLESELFGYEKGAFTGAVKQTNGKVELADGGTLFLDEIGDMPLALQAKLLRFLQGRVIERVGGRTEIPINVRVVCATNRNLQQFISEQRFREDLYYRIGEVIIPLPPLRERHGGPTVLAHAILRRQQESQTRRLRGFSEDAIAALETYQWPGNVRELENKVKTASIMAEGNVITAADLGLTMDNGTLAPLSLKEVRARAERRAITQAMLICENNVSRAAELLGITRPTLYDLMERYGMRGAE